MKNDYLEEIKNHQEYLNREGKRVKNCCSAKLDFYTEEQKIYVYKLYEQNYTYREIADKTGIDETSCVEIVGLFLDGTLSLKRKI